MDKTDPLETIQPVHNTGEENSDTSQSTGLDGNNDHQDSGLMEQYEEANNDSKISVEEESPKETNTTVADMNTVSHQRTHIRIITTTLDQGLPREIICTPCIT